jgi:hypothetical protein
MAKHNNPLLRFYTQPIDAGNGIQSAEKHLGNEAARASKTELRILSSSGSDARINQQPGRRGLDGWQRGRRRSIATTVTSQWLTWSAGSAGARGRGRRGSRSRAAVGRGKSGTAAKRTPPAADLARAESSHRVRFASDNLISRTLHSHMSHCHITASFLLSSNIIRAIPIPQFWL